MNGGHNSHAGHMTAIHGPQTHTSMHSHAEILTLILTQFLMLIF